MADYTASIALNAEGNAAEKLGEVRAELKSLVAEIAAMAGMSLGFAEFIKTGIEFNQLLENTRLGIAGGILATREWRDANGELVGGQQAVNNALEESTTIQKEIREAASQTGATVGQLAQAYQMSLPLAAKAGVKSQEDLLEITVKATQAMASMGLNTENAAHEIRGMLEGAQGMHYRLNQALGVTKEELEKVRASGGDVAQVFRDHLAPYAAMAGEGMKSLTVKLSNLKDAFEEAAAASTGGLFEQLKQGISDVTEWLKESETEFKAFGGVLSSVASNVGELFSSVFGQLFEFMDGGVKGMGLSWTNVWTVVGLAFNDLMRLLKIGFGSLAAVMTHPLDMWIAALGTILSGVLSLFAEVESHLPDFLGGKEMKKSFDQASDAVLLWATKENKAVEGMAKVKEKADDEWLAHRNAILEKEAEILENSPIGTRVSTSTPKATPPDAAIQKAIEQWSLFKQKVEAGISGAGLEGLDKALSDTAKKYADIDIQIDAFVAKVKGKYPGVVAEAAALKTAVDAAAQSAFNLDYSQASAKYIADLDKITEKVKTSAADRLLSEQKVALGAIEASRKAAISQTNDQAMILLAAATAADAELHIEEDTAQKLTILSAGVSGDWTGAFDALVQQGTKAGKTIQETWTEVASWMTRNAVTAEQGVLAGYAQIMASIKTTGQAVAENVKAVWDAVGKGIEDGLFNVLSGKANALKDVFAGIWNDILRSFSKMVRDMIQQWIIGQNTIVGKKEDGSPDSGMGGGATGITTALKGSGGSFDFSKYGAALGIGAVAVAASYAGDKTLLGSQVAQLGLQLGAALALVNAWVALAVVAVGIAVSALQPRQAELEEGFNALTYLPSNMTPMTTRETAGREAVNAFSSQIIGLLNSDSVSGSTMVALYQSALTKSLKNFAGVIHAGASGDFDADWTELFKTLLPKMALASAFGQHGLADVPAGFNLAPGQTSDFFKGPLGSMGGEYYQKTAAIPAFLNSIGVSWDKIENIAKQINTADPQTLLTYITSLAKVFMAARDLGVSLARTGEEWMTYLTDQSNLTDAQRLTTAVAALKGRGNQLNDLSGQEQVDAAQKLTDDIQKVVDAMTQALEAIRKAVADGVKAVDDIITQTNFAMLTADQQNAQLAGTATGAESKMLGATTWNDAQAAFAGGVAAFQALISSALQLRQAAMNAQAAIRGYIAAMDGTAVTYTTLADIQKGAADASLLTGQAQVDKINEVGAAAMALWTANKAAIDAIKADLLVLAATAAGLVQKADNSGKTPAQIAAENEAIAYAAIGKVQGAATWADAKAAADAGFAAFSAMLDAAIAWKTAALGTLDEIEGFQATMNGTAETFSSAADIQKGLAKAATMSGEAQQQEIKKVAEAAYALWQSNVQQIAALKAMAASIKQSVADQIFGIDLGEMDAKGQAGAIGDRINELYASLKKATSSEQVQTIMGQIQSYGSQYLSQFAKDDPNRAAAVKWLEGMLNQAGTTSQELLSGWGDALQTENDKLAASMEIARLLIVDNIGAATDAIYHLKMRIIDLGDAVQHYGTKSITDLEAENEKLRLVMVALDGELTALIGTTETGIKGLEQGLADLKAAFILTGDRFADEIVAAVKPLTDELDAMRNAINGVVNALNGTVNGHQTPGLAPGGIDIPGSGTIGGHKVPGTPAGPPDTGGGGGTGPDNPIAPTDPSLIGQSTSAAARLGDVAKAAGDLVTAFNDLARRVGAGGGASTSADRSGGGSSSAGLSANDVVGIVQASMRRNPERWRTA